MLRARGRRPDLLTSSAVLLGSAPRHLSLASSPGSTPATVDEISLIKMTRRTALALAASIGLASMAFSPERDPPSSCSMRPRSLAPTRRALRFAAAAHPGAQAIVGNVLNGSAGSSHGGGVIDENWNQPHAKGELPAPSPSGLSEVWCEDERRESVPVAGRGR